MAKQGAFSGTDTVEVTAGQDAAFAHALLRGKAISRVLQKAGGQWLLIHPHVSCPHHPETDEARTGLRP
jgi:ribosomal protein L16/L10AE